VAVGRLPDMLLVPVESVFAVDGRAVVYRLTRGAFVPVVVEVVKRGKEQAAIKANLQPGDRIARTKPSETRESH